MSRDLVYVALGSNLGDRAAHLAAALHALAALPGTSVVARSALEETEPFGAPGQGPYMNQMVALRTALEPRALLDELHAIEAANGRTRAVRWGARTLDLDIVHWPGRECRDERLTIPHPGIDDREFWRRQMAALGVATPHLTSAR